MSELNRGVAFGVTAYLLWGLFPLYWPLLDASGATEILAHRMVWSLAAVLGVLAVRRHWTWLRRVFSNKRQLAILSAAAVAISVNWGVFIYTVNSGHTLQSSLGYFINPLVSVVFGVVFFRDRLRIGQWVAVALGALAVLVLTFGYGGPPWMALALAFSFGTYGLLKKFVKLDGVESLTVETMVVFLPALGYVLALEFTGAATFGHISLSHTLLMICAGAITAAPLLFFGAAAFRIPLSMVGMLQFIVPVMHFLIGWLVFQEAMSVNRWIGFAIVWSALSVFAFDMLRNARRNARNRVTAPVAEPAEVPVSGAESARG